MQEDFNKNFLKNSDETGRHIVISNRTGGSIKPTDSMLDEEMFKITMTSVGESVQSVIERLDAQYPDKE